MAFVTLGPPIMVTWSDTVTPRTWAPKRRIVVRWKGRVN